jgi:hypothetical protein
MIVFFVTCAAAFVQCSGFYKKTELYSKLDSLVNDTYGGDQKRSKCMQKHLRDKLKHPLLAVNVSNTLEKEEFDLHMQPYIDVAVKDCTAYSWFIFFISAMAILVLICLSIYVVDCICTKVKGEEPEKEEKEGKEPSV